MRLGTELIQMIIWDVPMVYIIAILTENTPLSLYQTAFQGIF